MVDTRLAVSGPSGRMGQTLIRLIADTPGIVLSGAIARPGSATIGCDSGKLAGLEANGVLVGDDPSAVLAGTDGLLDFTTPATSVALAALAAERGIVHVIGTTGL